MIDLLYFLIFFLFSQAILLFIIKYTILIEYFQRLLPVLIGYSCLSGFIFNIINLNTKFYWNIIFSLFLLAVIEKKYTSNKAERYKNEEMSESPEDKKLYLRLSMLIYNIFFAASYIAVSNSLIKLF